MLTVNTLIASVVLGFVIAGGLAITRSREDAEKGVGAYIIKSMIVVCPIIYLGLVVLNSNNTIKTGGAGLGPVLDMRTGSPDF